MVATEGSDDVHETEAVRTAVEPSEYFPVATNCRVVPATSEAFAGVTVIELITAGVTCSVAV
jgi:hypothetical protein